MATSSDPFDRCPVFIHSLFRSGSTYLFKVFRRSAGYWCYQEPLHEAVIEANNEPSLLLADRSDDLVVQLRHPTLELAYFKELHEVWPAWKDCLDQAAIYDAYFAPGGRDIGIAYWRVLAQAAKGRPVFQECRTSGRIKEIRECIGGRHIYLWRNPWDQWWSHKVQHYFGVANLIIVNASGVPAPVEKLRNALNIGKRDISNVADTFAYYWPKPVSSEDSYQIFYMLWCLGQYEGMMHADLMLNIDRLSDSPTYRYDRQETLLNAGIPGIDFADCHVPQGRYLEQDRAFFEPLEERVHHWLLEGGWSPAQLEQVQSLRQQFTPTSWKVPLESCVEADLAEQASRARALARRHETQLSESVSILNKQNAETEVRAQQAEVMVQQAKASACDAHRYAAQAEARAVELEGRLAHADFRASEAESLIYQAKMRVEQAEARASEASSHTAQAEVLVRQAEARIAELESRLASADSRASEAERQVAVSNLRVAEAQTRERDLLNSASWKITSPLRYLASPMLDLRRKMDQGRISNPTTVRGGLPSFAMRAWVGLQNYHRLRLFVLGTLRHFPVLDFKLRRMYEQSMIGNQLPVTDWHAVERDRIGLSSGIEPFEGISLSTGASSASALPISFRPLPSGVNAAQRTPLEANYPDCLERR